MKAAVEAHVQAALPKPPTLSIPASPRASRPQHSPGRLDAARGLLALSPAHAAIPPAALRCEYPGCQFVTHDAVLHQGHALGHLRRGKLSAEDKAVVAMASRRRVSLTASAPPLPLVLWDTEEDYMDMEQLPERDWKKYVEAKTKGRTADAEEHLKSLFIHIGRILRVCTESALPVKAKKWQWLKSKVEFAARHGHLSYNLSYKVHGGSK